MKKIIIIIILMLPVGIFGQDIINPAPLNYKNTNSQYFQTNRNEFIKGQNGNYYQLSITRAFFRHIQVCIGKRFGKILKLLLS